MYEAQCTAATAQKVVEMDKNRPEGATAFGAALGMPLTIRDDIPEGIVRIANNGSIIKDIQV
jgi:hypothetical protein